jgi:hypothetical protein
MLWCGMLCPQRGGQRPAAYPAPCRKGSPPVQRESTGGGGVRPLNGIPRSLCFASKPPGSVGTSALQRFSSAGPLGCVCACTAAGLNLESKKKKVKILEITAESREI